MYEEDNILKSKYFHISQVPDFLPIGKSSFLINLDEDILKINTEIKVEILDVHGNVIYTEYPYYLENTARRVAIEVYPDILFGMSTISVIGEAIHVPNTWKGKYNVRWTHKLMVYPDEKNISPIRFYYTPTLSITGTERSYVHQTYGTQLAATASIGQIMGDAGNENFNMPPLPWKRKDGYKLMGGKDYVIYLNGSTFDSYMEGGAFIVSDPNSHCQNTGSDGSYSFETIIKDVVNSNVAITTDPYVVYDEKFGSAHWRPDGFYPSNYELRYYLPPTGSTVNEKISYADVLIDNMRTFSGEVYGVRLYKKSIGMVGVYEMVADNVLESNELLVDPDDLFEEKRTGYFFNQSWIDTWWTASYYRDNNLFSAPNNPIFLNWNPTKFLDSICVSSSYFSKTIDRTKVFSLNNIEFTEDVEYSLRFKLYGEKTNITSSYSINNTIIKDGSIEFYISGTSFYSTNNVLGKKLGELEIEGGLNSKYYKKVQIDFVADTTGNGSVVFAIKSGKWHISDVSIMPSYEPGFSPGTFMMSAPIFSRKINDRLDFKLEFYDRDGNLSDVVIYDYNIGWNEIEETPDNILFNGSFENVNHSAGWTTSSISSSIGLYSTDSYSGSYALKMLSEGYDTYEYGYEEPEL